MMFEKALVYNLLKHKKAVSGDLIRNIQSLLKYYKEHFNKHVCSWREPGAAAA
jgi:hypothetical protein